jgi:L-fuculose-phosphate aldolase
MNELSHPHSRRAVIDACLSMNRLGINQGASGNASLRVTPETLLITPSGMAYEAMSPADIVEMNLSGDWTAPTGRRPSSEWRFHRDILAARPDINVVLHAHSTFATALAVHERGIPPFHYMVALAGGEDIRCAPYATFGSQELSDNALLALSGRTACLLGHHGMIVLGKTPESALALAVEVETLARQYIHALALGEPPLLSKNEIDRVKERMHGLGYGKG